MGVNTQHLFVKTLIAPELQNEAALLERVKKMPRKDRVELMKALDVVSQSLSSPQPPRLSDRGVEVLLLADTDRPYDPDYNFKFELVGKLTKGHSNSAVFEKIKSVRKALLKIYSASAAPLNPAKIIETHTAQLQNLDTECARLTEQMKSKKHEIVLGHLRRSEDAMGDITTKSATIMDSDFYTIMCELKLALRTQHDANIVDITDQLFPLFTLLPKADSLLLTDLQRNSVGIQFSKEDLEEAVKHPDNPAAAVISKHFERKLKEIRKLLEDDLALVNSARQEQLGYLEEERAVLHERLQQFVSHKQSVEAAAVEFEKDFIDLGSDEYKNREDMQALEKMIDPISFFANALTLQNLSNLDPFIDSVLKGFEALRDVRGVKQTLEFILLEFGSISTSRTSAKRTGHIKTLLSQLKTLHGLSSDPKVSAAFEALSTKLTQKLDSVVCADQEMVEVVKDSAAFVVLILGSMLEEITQKNLSLSLHSILEEIPEEQTPVPTVEAKEKKE